MTNPLCLYTQKRPQIFEKLSEESLQKLLEHSIIKDFDGGRLLVQQGDLPSYVYLILEGSLKTTRIDAEGGEAVIRMLKPGDVCMEAVMFMGCPSPINVQTLGGSKLLMIPEKIVMTHVLEDAQFAHNLLRIVTRHYKNAMHQIDAVNIKSPLQRVGYYFLLQHLEKGHDNLNFDLPFRKQTIASYLGMTPETFSRTLKQLKEFGVNIDGDSISLKDSFALCHFCDSDTEALCSMCGTDECQKCPFHDHNVVKFPSGSKG